jgi:asparagine synthase (glutamine-hydrolysing)
MDRGLFRPGYVRQLLDEHASGARLHHTRIWALLMLELWFRMWIDPTAAPLEPPAEPAVVVVE